jgi:NHL repeat-containing protein
MRAPRGALILAVLAVLGGGVGAGGAPTVEVVATGIARPLELAIDRDGVLVVLSPGTVGDSAGEIVRVPLDAGGSRDLSDAPRIRIPFAAGPRPLTLGSLAVEPGTGDLFLGEENGTRIYRRAADGRLELYAIGLHRLAGGTALAFDGQGRLLVVDYADPSIEVSAGGTGLPELEWLRDEDYRGPLLFRLDLDPEVTRPRDLERAAPLFPHGWGGRAGGGLLPRLIAVAAGPAGTVFVLGSMGEVFRVSAAGELAPLARLPLGQYHRISMTATPDGSLLVSGGFHIGRIFRVTPDGAVSTLARDLADPEGIALDPAGRVYVAESALHRIVRLRLPP